MQAYGKENIHTPSSSNSNEPQVTSPASTKPAPVRPLTAAYQAARSDHQVILRSLYTGHTGQGLESPQERDSYRKRMGVLVVSFRG